MIKLLMIFCVVLSPALAVAKAPNPAIEQWEEISQLNAEAVITNRITADININAAAVKQTQLYLDSLLKYNADYPRKGETVAAFAERITSLETCRDQCDEINWQWDSALQKKRMAEFSLNERLRSGLVSPAEEWRLRNKVAESEHAATGFGQNYTRCMTKCLTSQQSSPK